MDKVFLPFYYSWRDKTKNLSDEEFGKLTRAILLYSETGELTNGFSATGEMAYEFITDVIKRSQKKSDDGRKGAYKRWNTHIAPHCDTNAINTNKNKNTNKVKEESIKEETRKRFLPPSLDEVKRYCSERGNNVDAQRFVDYYTANGWMQAKDKPIKDWKAAVRIWENNDAAKQERYVDVDDAFQKALQRSYGKRIT